MTHSELVPDLVRSIDRKRWVVMTELSVGREHGSGRADVVAISKRNYASPKIVIYEVKATRGDLLSDLKAEKWRKYLPHCNHLVFALGEGISDWKEIDLLWGNKHLGVRIQKKGSWTTLRKGGWRPVNMTFDLALNFINRLSDDSTLRSRRLEQYKNSLEWARTIRGLESKYRKRFKSEIDRLEAARRELNEAMSEAQEAAEISV